MVRANCNSPVQSIANFVSFLKFFGCKIQTDLEYERYKDFDFSDAKPSTHPFVLEFRARKKAYDAFMTLFDDDVRQIFIEQEQSTQADRTRLNAVIRALYAV